MAKCAISEKQQREVTKQQQQKTNKTKQKQT